MQPGEAPPPVYVKASPVGGRQLTWPSYLTPYNTLGNQGTEGAVGFPLFEEMVDGIIRGHVPEVTNDYESINSPPARAFRWRWNFEAWDGRRRARLRRRGFRQESSLVRVPRWGMRRQEDGVFRQEIVSSRGEGGGGRGRCSNGSSSISPI